MTLKNLIKYSGLWFGLVINPHHWQFKIKTGSDGILEDDVIFGLSIYLGPVWGRLVVDDGSW
jgi:hypothetical protein